MRLAVLVTHPVQYFAPVFRELAQQPDLQLKVFFGCNHGVIPREDPNFGVVFKWDCKPTVGFEHEFLSTSSLADLQGLAGVRLATKAAVAISRYQPDAVLIFAYSPVFITASTLLLHLAGHKLMLRAETTDEALTRSYFKDKIRQLLLACYYRQFAHFFPIGTHSINHYLRMGVDESRLTLVHYAIDTDFFQQQVDYWLPQRECLRAIAGIGEQDYVLIYCGKMFPAKNPLLIPEAIAMLSPVEREKIWLLAVGDGELREQFERMAKALLGERAIFVCFKNQSELGMNSKILIIGHTSGNYHIGSMLIRAAQKLNLQCAVSSNSWENYAPSMKHIWGKAFFRLSDKRPMEWWSLNRKTIDIIRKFEPQLVLVTGIFPLMDELFQSIKNINANIVNFLTDDPWVKQLYSSVFIANLKNYDLVISTKKRVIPDLIASGVKRAEFLPYAYDPFWLHLPEPVSEFEKEKFLADISFVGTGSLERLPMLEAVASLGNLNLKLYGNDWERISIKGWKQSPAVFDNEYRLAMYLPKIALCLLRKRSRDDATQRTFEIAPCGGCGIYEDAPEHRDILAGYPEYGFFSSPEDLANKCKWLLEHPVEREQMRQLGIQLIVTEANTYVARLKTILEWVSN